MEEHSKKWTDCLKSEELFGHPGHSLAWDYLMKFDYPWEALTDLGQFILSLGKSLDPKEYRKIGEDVWISNRAVVAPSAFIGGPAIIGANTEIRHCAFIRGSALVGEGCVVGNSVELKNCILFDGVQVPHFNYVGDSVLGYRSHMGAGSVTSNVKSDKTPVSVRYGAETLPTNRKKMGAILGDFVEVGCNSVLNPGTVIGRNTNVYPLSSVRGFVPENHIFKSPDRVTVKK